MPGVCPARSDVPSIDTTPSARQGPTQRVGGWASACAPQHHVAAITGRRTMQEKVSDTKASPAGDLDPHWNWGRQLPSSGIMGVDFESRVEFDRMRRYRLARARQALERSELGALLLFDVNNIRYVSATKIGEWERD